MQRLSDFLSRFQRMTPPDAVLKKLIAKTIGDVAGVPVSAADVTLSHNVAFVKCSSVAKNAIRLLRTKILEELVREHPKARDAVRDIR